MRKVRSVRLAPFVLKASLLTCAVLGACGGGASRHYVSQGTPTAPGGSALIVADVNGSTSTTQVNLKDERLPPPVRLGGTSFAACAKPGEDDRSPVSAR
ncbi:hypothetical protein [Sorangium sp. So ce128]|uniref:hypothetical protein n=1 Tax=Sorangium sp. So ce128 TaxID=3133281 RepID=UPI003F641510